MMDDLFPETRARQELGPGAFMLGGFARGEVSDLLNAIEAVAD